MDLGREKGKISFPGSLHVSLHCPEIAIVTTVCDELYLRADGWLRGVGVHQLPGRLPNGLRAGSHFFGKESYFKVPQFSISIVLVLIVLP